MRTTIPINPSFRKADKDLIKDYVSVNPIRRNSTGNQLLFYRAGAGVFGGFSEYTVQVSHGDIGIITDAAAGLFSEREDSLLGHGHVGREDSDVETVVIDASGYIRFGQGLPKHIVNTGASISSETSSALAMAISRPTTASHIDVLRDWFEDYVLTRIHDRTEKITEYYEERLRMYEEQLSIKESEIKALSSELSQIKEGNQRRDREAEQIRNHYRQELAKIPEAQQALWKQNQREIQFILALDDMSRDLSDRLGEIEDQLEDDYPNWIFDFEYVGHRISSQQFQQTYLELFARD